MPIDPEALTAAEETPSDEKGGYCALRVIGWLSVGVAVAALGLFAGNAGEQQASEFGLGV